MLSDGSLAIRAEKFQLFNRAAILCQDNSHRITKWFKFRNFRHTWSLLREKKYFRTIFSVTATKLKYILTCSVNVRSHKYPKCGLRIWHLNAVFYSQACLLPLTLFVVVILGWLEAFSTVKWPLATFGKAEVNFAQKFSEDLICRLISWIVRFVKYYYVININKIIGTWCMSWQNHARSFTLDGEN